MASQGLKESVSKMKVTSSSKPNYSEETIKANVMAMSSVTMKNTSRVLMRLTKPSKSTFVTTDMTAEREVSGAQTMAVRLICLPQIAMQKLSQLFRLSVPNTQTIHYPNSLTAIKTTRTLKRTKPKLSLLSLTVLKTNVLRTVVNLLWLDAVATKTN